jgi:hypothetical protein
MSIPKKWTRHGQMEIMGLVIIVILISLAVLFTLQLAIGKGGGGQQDTFTQEQLAENMLNTFLRTSTTCNKDTKELIQDCDAVRVVDCDGDDTPDSPCEEVEELSSSLFDTTLGMWGKSYVFTVTTGSNAEIIGSSSGTCPGQKDASVQPIPSKPPGNTLFVQLDVCSR